MEKFLSCDWGTSSFRLRVVELNGTKVIAGENDSPGIAKVFELWKMAGQPEALRFPFYLEPVRQSIGSIQKKLNCSLDGFPLVISGMACSTLGMIDLPYKEVPFYADGSDLITKAFAATDDFKHDIIFISGARTESDVMRGEETQLVGCVPGKEEQLFIFPGTHSKHVTVKEGKAVAIKTYMTGEFFALLSTNSVLSASIERPVDSKPGNKKAFEAGVKESLHSNLLHSSFKIRTNDLFHNFSREENFHYLSGLLIGTEMRELAGTAGSITLVTNSQLHAHYELAFDLIMENPGALKFQDADEAIVKGQSKIWNRLVKQKLFSDGI